MRKDKVPKDISPQERGGTIFPANTSNMEAQARRCGYRKQIEKTII